MSVFWIFGVPSEAGLANKHSPLRYSLYHFEPCAKTFGTHCSLLPVRKVITNEFEKISVKTTHVCVSGGKKCSFLGKFVMLCFLETLVLRFALLPYYRRYLFSHPTLNRLKQTKVYHTFFHFLWKGATYKSLKVAAAKTIFSSVYPIGMTCFDVFYFMW